MIATIKFHSISDLKDFIKYNSFTEYSIDGGSLTITVNNAKPDAFYNNHDVIKEIVVNQENET